MSNNKKIKIALFLADGCEEIEALTVADLLYRADISCTTVSVTDSRDVVSSHNIHIVADTVIGELDFDAYDMLVLPGGMPGTTNLRACDALTAKLVEFAGSGKQVAAICAAPSVLAGLGLLQGKKASCNPSVEEKLIKGGALLSQDPVSVDGNIITSRSMGTAIPFGLEIVAHYQGREAADRLAANILYK